MASLQPASLLSVKTSPALELARLKWESAQLNERLQKQRTGLVTQVSASYGLRRSLVDSQVSSDQSRSMSASVNFSLPILDWGTDALQRREAIEAKVVAEREWREAERQFAAERELIVDEGERLKERRQLAQRLFDLERKSFQQIMVDYREGRTTYLDWLSASQNLRAAVQSQIELANEWAKYWLRVQSFRGELADEVCP
jgi:outer membrane protein TolC